MGKTDVLRLALLLLTLALPSRAHAEERFALLIGNQGYNVRVGPLINPHNDVALVGSALEKLGFHTTIIKDADYRTIKTEINKYIAAVAQAGVGAISFVYYSGHGAARPDTNLNYLIPTDVMSADDDDLWANSLNLNTVVQGLRSQAPGATHFIVFDACRNELNLTRRDRKGFADKGFVPIAHTQGVMIAFSTEPGKTASDSGIGGGSYAKALADEMVKPGVEAVTMFRNVALRVKGEIGQDPWMQTSTLRSVYFAGEGESNRVVADAGGVGTRVALVIGNGAYRHAPRLVNPSRDATAMADLFRRAGFKTVKTANDVNGADFRRALADFVDIAQNSDIAVVYYAGLGIQLADKSYLIPVDAKLAREYDAKDETVSLERITEAIEPARRLHLVILEACRATPFLANAQRSRTTATTAGVQGQTLIAYAAKAGSSCEDDDRGHSQFTTALLKNIAEPGLDIRLAFARVKEEVLSATAGYQEPYVDGSLGGPNISLAPAPSVVQNGPTDAKSCKSDYELVERVNTKHAWEIFVDNYKTGYCVDLAKERLTQLREEEDRKAKAAEEAKNAAELAKIEQVKKAAEEERRALELARTAAEEEARKAAEEARKEGEAKRIAEASRAAEAAAAAEEARKVAEEAKKAEEQARAAIEEQARKAAEDARKEAEVKRLAEAKKAEEAKKAAEEEKERLRAEAKRLAEAKRAEEAAKAAVEEAARKAAEEARRQAEARRLAEIKKAEEAKKAAEEEAARLRAEAKRLAEAKRAEEAAKAERARKAAEEEARRQAEAKRLAEAKKAEEEARAERARKAAEEEAKRQAEAKRLAEAKKAEEEARAERARAAEEEARRQAEAKRLAEAKKAEEEARAAAEKEARRAAEEARRQAEAKRITEAKRAEEAAQKAEQARRAAQEAKEAEVRAKAAVEEQARKAADEALRQAEIKRQAEARKVEEARLAAEAACRREEERLFSLEADAGPDRENLVRLQGELKCERLRPIIVAMLAQPVTRKQSEANTLSQVREAQSELRRIGCFSGPVNGVLDAQTKGAIERYFAKHEGQPIKVEINDDFVNELQHAVAPLCPLVCPPGQTVKEDHCVASANEEQAASKRHSDRKETKQGSKRPRESATRESAARPRPQSSSSGLRGGGGSRTMTGIGF
jgi:uncharacterized caspase-like protein